MPAKKSSPKTVARSAKSENKSFGRVVVVVLAILGAMIVIGFGLHIRQERLVQADKARFVQAEKDVAELSSKIVAATGEPLKAESTESCTRPHLKFDNGPLSCDVDQSLFYPVDNDIHANSVFSSVSGTAYKYLGVKKSTYFSDGLNSNAPFKPLFVKSSDSTFHEKAIEEYYDGNSRMLCDIVYEFYAASDPPYPEYKVLADSGYLINVSLSCGDFAKAQHYPMAN